MVKVLISYDMMAGKEQEAQDFLINKMAPGLARLGFRISDVQYTIWGNSPQTLSGGEVENLEQAQKIFLSDSWERLARGTEALTQNFKVRAVKSRHDHLN